MDPMLKSELERLQRSRERIDKRIDQIENRKQRPEIPKRPFDALKRTYNELIKGKEEAITIDGVRVIGKVRWEGKQGSLYGKGWHEPCAEWEFVKIPNNKAYNNLIQFLIFSDNSELDDAILDEVYSHKLFWSYDNKINDFIDKVENYERKYNFLFQDLLDN